MELKRTENKGSFSLRNFYVASISENGHASLSEELTKVTGDGQSENKDENIIVFIDPSNQLPSDIISNLLSALAYHSKSKTTAKFLSIRDPISKLSTNVSLKTSVYFEVELDRERVAVPI